MDHELLLFDFENELNFLMPLFFVPVAEGVDHAFPHGHADLQAVVIVESGGPGDALGDAFGEGDAVEQRLHDHFDAVGITGHEVYEPTQGSHDLG